MPMMFFIRQLNNHRLMPLFHNQGWTGTRFVESINSLLSVWLLFINLHLPRTTTSSYLNSNFSNLINYCFLCYLQPASKPPLQNLYIFRPSFLPFLKTDASVYRCVVFWLTWCGCTVSVYTKHSYCCYCCWCWWVMMMLCDWADCAREDSGNYTCEVRGKRSTTLASVTHHLYVRGILSSHAIRTWYIIHCA